MKLSHVAADGSIAMVDVSGKAVTQRHARARAIVRLNDAARTAVREATLAKGDALVAAQLAGIMAAKRTAELIPLAHPLPLASVGVTFAWQEDGALAIDAEARTSAQTGVEMEAMVAASVAALTVYDMAKALDRRITIESVRLLEKTGGKNPFEAAGSGQDGS
ncbi:MAG TPA: cyclic pyranopterin monophosphate synthase MoaC [Candidatus Cybelea sp.]|jgi:cyclic pyranopterin phosphate synthase|nr:cyclic pyranopterin monophosphate synthase MoaC [Candidatus Cybelea sp.]